jgi:hypothetical protein
MNFVSILFFVLVALMLILQLFNLAINGISRETLIVVSEILSFLFFGVVFFVRNKLSKIMTKKGLNFRFMFFGILSAIVIEVLFIFSMPIYPDLFFDLILTLPWYFLWFLAWYIILTKYNFSIKEAFIIGGFHGFLIEAIISPLVFNGVIGNIFLLIISIPLITCVYGCFFIIPYLILKKDFKKQKEVSLQKKILLSLIPLCFYVFEIIWVILLKITILR